MLGRNEQGKEGLKNTVSGVARSGIVRGIVGATMFVAGAIWLPIRIGKAIVRGIAGKVKKSKLEKDKSKLQTVGAIKRDAKGGANPNATTTQSAPAMNTNPYSADTSTYD